MLIVSQNGSLILSADNQFRTFVVPITNSDLKEKNEMLLHFKSAGKLAKELEARYGRVRAGSNNLGEHVISGTRHEV
jgi:beta-mannosidase